jgi:hypothetical protein
MKDADALSGYLVLALMFLPAIGFGFWGWRNAREFREFCRQVAVEEGVLDDLKSTVNLDGGFFNEFERAQYKRLSSEDFESYSNPHVLSQARSLSRRIRGMTVFFSLYLLVFVGYFSTKA